MKNIKQQIKALELDPKKEYFLICDRTAVTAHDLSQVTKYAKNIKFGFIAYDINNIQLKELDDLAVWIDNWREKKKHA